MKNKKLLHTGLILLILSLVFYGCLRTESSEDSGPAVPQEVADAVTAVMDPIFAYMDLDPASITNPYTEVSGIVFNFNGTSSVVATFTNYIDSSTGYSISGVITLVRTISTDETTVTIVGTGTASLTGGSISELVFDIAANGPYDKANDDFAGEPVFSGTVTADGTVYNYADYVSEKSGDNRTTDPRFVVAAMNGTIVFSADGSSWGYPNVAESGDTGASVDLLDIACDSNGDCVAVGQNGTILYSTNGVTWSGVNSGIGTSVELRSVTWAGGRWVALSDASASGGIFYSDDGQTWSSASITGGNPTQIFDVAGDGSGDFIAVGTTYTVVRSIDNGVSWVLHSPSFTSNEFHFRGITYDADNLQWVAVGDNGLVAYSDDMGATWQVAVHATSLRLSGISYGNGQYVAVGPGAFGEAAVMIGSSDGINWSDKTTTLPTEFVSRSLKNIATDGNGRWSAVGNGGDHLLSIDNGSTWQVIALDKYGSHAIAYRP